MAPEFSLAGLISLTLPLFTGTGLFSLAAAPFGAMRSISASALCTSGRGGMASTSSVITS
jgi:predicted benzoate:H+ symporter BenE